MKLYKSILAVALAGTMLTGCREDFAELNQNPGSITTAEPAFLFASLVNDFETSEYTYWFYNGPMFWKWSQMLTPSAGLNAQFTETTAGGAQGSQYIYTLRYRNEINNFIKEKGEEGAKYKAWSAAATVLTVYTAIFDSDMQGDMPYTEACMLKYGGPLTPKYDKQSDLYGIWLNELDEAIATFSMEGQDMTNRASQDVVFKGDMKKWAKFANSTKLKIAARWINQDRAKALQIASEVASAPCGYIDSAEDDMIFAKATTNVNNEDIVYHFGNGISVQAASRNVVNFMKESLDPRVRFCYSKDGFNSKIVQGFIDAGKYNDLPEYVKKNAVLDENGNFKEWGGLGEPWVRYNGQVIAYEKQNDPAFAGDLNPGERYNLKIGDKTKSYSHLSYVQEEMVRGRVDYTIPTLPGDKTVQDIDNIPWWGMYLTTAEVNLYFAEFKLLGANLPKSAEEYYNRGVRASVEEYDRVAGLNKIPYYAQTYDYDPNEKVIALQEGEIDAMMATENVKLAGTVEEQLEKVYLQQLMHFTMAPGDQFTTVRRSGCPKAGSSLLPFVYFDEVVKTGIPRRLEFSAPSPTDKMKEQIEIALKNQGFTPGSAQSGNKYNSTGSVLNTERFWFDQNNPNFGEGPKM